MKNILLVCTGNTCRSSMAEGVLKHILQERKYSNVEVKSAGTSVFMSQPANEKAVIIMREMGIDINKHMSRPLNDVLIDHADIILTMTCSHKESVQYLFPQAIDKVFTLKEHLTYLLGEKGTFEDLDNSLEIFEWDITDPYGKNLEEYRKTAQEIKYVLERIVGLIF